MTFWTCVWMKAKSARRSVKLKYKQLKTEWLWLLSPWPCCFFYSLLSFHDISFYWNEANTKSIRQSAAEKNEFRSSNYSLEKIETFFSPYRPVCISYVYRNPKLQNVLMLYLNLSTVRTLSVKTMSLVVPLLQTDLSFLCLMMHEMAICVLLDFCNSFTSSSSF